jgi:hypothetical protein
MMNYFVQLEGALLLVVLARLLWYRASNQLLESVVFVRYNYCNCESKSELIEQTEGSSILEQNPGQRR